MFITSIRFGVEPVLDREDIDIVYRAGVETVFTRKPKKRTSAHAQQ